MARDYSIRRDLQRLALPERTIRILERAAELVQIIDDQATLEAQQAATDAAVDAAAEDIENANLSIDSLDSRVDVLEAGNGPYVKKAGDTMTGALDVQALLTCDSFRIDQAPAAAAAVPSTHKITISANGVTYYLLASNV